MAAIPVPAATENVKATAQRAVASAAAHAADLAEQARDVKARAADAFADYQRTMTREVGRAVRRVEYARDETAYRIQRAPFTAIMIACAAGFIGGVATAWLFAKSRNAACSRE